MKLFTLFFCFFTFTLSANELVYNISSSGTSIGQIKITKTITDDVVEITAKSEVKVNLFLSLDVSYSLHTIYKNNELISSTVTTYVNGKEHSKTLTKRFNQYYLITSDDDSKKLSHSILYSGALLYFQPPLHQKVVYSEIDGIEKPISEISSSKFQITNPKTGHTSIYEYTKNIANKITINHTLLTFTLDLK